MLNCIFAKGLQLMLTSFVSLFFYFAPLLSQSLNDIQSFNVDNRVEIIFLDHIPTACEDKQFFEKQKENYYRYNEYVFQHDLDQQLAFSILVENDSFKVHDRYATCYGYRISETEGVIRYSPQQAKNNFGVLKYSEWKEVKSVDAKKSAFDFSHHSYESDYWQPITPSVAISTLEEWRKSHGWKNLVSKENLGVHTYLVEICVTVYLNGKASYTYLQFMHRHGEC
jgi:hypothetical protein